MSSLKTIAALFCLCAAAHAGAQTTPPDIRGAPVEEARSIVRVIVTCQGFDTFRPWLKTAPAVKYGYGFVVKGGWVVTTEDLVRNATLVELQRALSGEKSLATIAQSDEYANLALLRPADPAALADMRPLELAEKVGRGDKINVLQFSDTGDIQQGSGQVVDVLFSDLPYAPGGSLIFNILTDLNVNGRGSLVLHDGKAAGLVMTYDRSSRTGNMLPYPAIRNFIRDAMDKPYRGLASAGFTWSSLVDPAERRYLKVPDAGKGVIVLSTLQRTGAAESLRPQDVLLAWDGAAIDNLGFYDDPDFGRLPFPYLIRGNRRPGDSVNVELIREGRPLSTTVSLVRQTDTRTIIPENVTGQQPEYLVEGGLVIRELTGEYLRAYGASWPANADSRLVNAYFTRMTARAADGERVVFLSYVLPDPINVGYQNIRDQIVTHVNDEKVANIEDVFRIADRDGGLTRVRLLWVEVDLVLDGKGLTAANRRVSEVYQIAALRYRRTTSGRNPAEGDPNVE